MPPPEGLVAPGAELPNGLNQALNILGRCELRNAMTQVKNVPNAGLKQSKALNGSGHLGSNMVWMTKQDRGIEVALNGALGTDAHTGLAKIDRPVDPKCRASRCSDSLKPQAPAFNKNNAWGVGKLLSKGGHHLGQKGLREPTKLGIGQETAPAVKKHNGLGAFTYLHGAVLNHQIGHFLKQKKHQVGPAVKPLTHL